jgi:hypothetical protein
LVIRGIFGERGSYATYVVTLAARGRRGHQTKARGVASVDGCAEATRRRVESLPNPRVQGYTFLYGPESYMSVHGGLDAMRRHIDVRTGRVRSEGWRYSGEDQQLELAVAMVSALANQLADRLDLDRAALDEFAREWQASLME